ncbi:MAG: solute:Na+ symporter, family [Halanaerobiales bacterium]|nr:solute:Na+ symporter, family [Halanaerobiales bacterium]
MSLQVIIFIIYFLLVLGIGVYSYQKTEEEADYWIAGGNLGWAVGGATIASTQMSAGLFIGTIGIMYSIGWSFAWVLLVFPISYWVMVSVIAPRFTKVKELTLPSFIERRYYSKSARAIAAVIILVSMVVYIQAQIVAGGIIANIVFGIPQSYGMVAFTIILLLYTFIGGMLAVVYTDFLQMMIMLLGAIVALPLSLHYLGGMSNLLKYVQAVNPITFTWKGMPPSLLFTIGLAFLLGSMARPEQLVRFYAMKDMKTIKRGILFTLILVGIAHFFVFFLALASRVFFPVLQKGDMAMPMIASGVLPIFVGTILLAAVTAAMMSTVDSLLIVAASALSHDIYENIFAPEASVNKKLWIGRIGVIIVGFMPVLLLLTGLSGGDIIQLIVALFSALMGASFLMPVLLGVLWKRTTKEGAIAAMIAGVLVTFLWKLYGIPTIDPVVPGFLASTILCVGVSLLTPPPPESAVSIYFD